MKLSFVAIGIISLLTPLTAAWSKEDREIFRIRDEIASHEVDPSATFYDILEISPSASLDDINKAYRKKSRSLHPDKVKQQLRTDKLQEGKDKDKGKKSAKAIKGPSQAEIRTAVKEASERQARLSLIANILRGPSRDRYDHFLTHGFPLWKGTDYYYNRYRPGLGTVMFGLFVVVGGGIHYLALYMSWKRQKEFVERYVKFARNAAWGNDAGIPNIDAMPAPPPAPVAVPDDDEAGPQMAMNRRQRRMQEKESRKEETKGTSKKGRKAALAASSSKSSSRETSAAPTGVRKRVVAENGKILVVDSQGDVFLEEQDEEGNVNEFLLDPDELPQPTISDTAVVRVPAWFFQISVGRFLSKKAEQDVEVEELEVDEESDAPQPTPSTDSAGEDFELLDKSTDSLGKVKASGAQAGSKAAAKRRGKKK